MIWRTSSLWITLRRRHFILVSKWGVTCMGRCTSMLDTSAHNQKPHVRQIFKSNEAKEHPPCPIRYGRHGGRAQPQAYGPAVRHATKTKVESSQPRFTTRETVSTGATHLIQAEECTTFPASPSTRLKGRLGLQSTL